VLGRLLEPDFLNELGVHGSHSRAALLNGLLDTSPFVRQAAALAVAHTIRRGDEEAITMVRPLLQDPSALVRCAAVEALGLLCKAGDRDTVAHVATRIRDATWPVREAAVMMGKRRTESATWAHKPYR